MSAQSDLSAVQEELRQLQNELAEAEWMADKLSASTSVDELARIRLGGGVIDFRQGPLQQLQALKLQREVLARAIELKTTELQQCQRRVAREALESLRKRRDAIVADYYLACGQLAQIKDKLIALDEQARRFDAECEEFRWDEFATRFADKASGPAAGETDQLAHLVFVQSPPQVERPDTLAFPFAPSEAA